MKLTILRYAACAAFAAALAACGGGGSSDVSSMSASSSGSSSTAQSGTMPLVVSDASSDDWALVGVKVLSIALVPQGGGDNVTVFSAGSSATYLNLEQLDNLGEILGNVSVPVGTYTGAVVTVGGKPGAQLGPCPDRPDLSRSQSLPDRQRVNPRHPERHVGSECLQRLRHELSADPTQTARQPTDKSELGRPSSSTCTYPPLAARG